MAYDASLADAFWSNRAEKTDELAAVLHYGMPRMVNDAHSKWELDSVLKSITDIGNKNILDLACGNGRVSIPLASISATVTAVDNAEGMLAKCRVNATEAGVDKKIEFVHASASNLPFEDEKFDVSLCLGLLEHLPSEIRELAVGELIRVTTRGGLIIITVNNANSIYLDRRPTLKITEQHKDGDLKGFFSSLCGKDFLERIFATKGCQIEVLGTNLFQSFAYNLFREIKPADADKEIWEELFKVTTKMDMMYRQKSGLDGILADQYTLKITRNSI